MAIAGFTFELLSIVRSDHAADDVVKAVPQFNSDYHFVHTTRGRAQFSHEGRRYAVSPDHVVAVPLLKKCAWHKKAGQAWHMVNFHCLATTRAGLSLHQQIELPIRFSPTNVRDIHKQLADTRDWLWRDGASPAAQCAAAATVGAIVASYLEEFGRPVQPRALDKPMLQLRHHIDQTVTRPFDAEALASDMHLSVSQMNRRFRNAVGLAPKAYRQQQRLAMAESALRDRNETIAEVSEALGFNDVAHFARWFKQQMGTPPGEYRRQSRTIER